MKTIAIVAFETNPAVNSSMMMHVDMMRDVGFNMVMFVQREVNLEFFKNYEYTIVSFEKPKELKSLFSEHKVDMVWCTNAIYVLKLLRVTKLPIHLWKQGDEASESFMRHKNYLRKWVLQIIDAYALRKVSGVTYVSDAMKDYYEKKYKVKTKSIVVPCLSEFVDVKTDVERIPDSFVYIGGLSVWQCFDEILELYAKIRTKKSVFHIITLDTAKAKETVLSTIGDTNNIEIYGIKDRSTIPSVLNKFQYGFLIRKRDVVNHVAAPIKFLEYLSCGVNVIMTDAVPSYARIVEKHGVGTVVDMNKSEITINAYNPESKNIYNKYFSREISVTDYGRLLD